MAYLTAKSFPRHTMFYALELARMVTLVIRIEFSTHLLDTLRSVGGRGSKVPGVGSLK